jgi:ADP-heptose:LPS heptosyltransferase
MTPNRSTGLVPDVRKIAVLRANGIGDFIFALPALEALRAAYPGASITLLGKAWHAELLKDRPGPVDRVTVVPPAAGVGEPENASEDRAELEAFFARMAEERFDLALQCHGGGRYSNPFVHLLGARVSAGLKTADAAPLSRSFPYVYWQNEIFRYLEIVKLVGATPVSFIPRLTVTEADCEASRLVVPVDDRPLAALNPGASDPERRWPPERFALVGDALAAAGARVVMTGAAWDQPLAAAIAGAMRADAEDVTGRLSLGGLAGLLSRCAVVVSNDSGPLHLARAVGAATVGIYWCFNAINAGPIEVAYHRSMISWNVSCPVCGIDRAHARCDHHPSFVAEVSPDAVIAAAMELLEMAR